VKFIAKYPFVTLFLLTLVVAIFSVEDSEIQPEVELESNVPYQATLRFKRQVNRSSAHSLYVLKVEDGDGPNQVHLIVHKGWIEQSYRDKMDDLSWFGYTWQGVLMGSVLADRARIRLFDTSGRYLAGGIPGDYTIRY
jgi:predicted RND superfamily exporter protein